MNKKLITLITSFIFASISSLTVHAVSHPIFSELESNPLSPKNIFNLHTGKNEIILTIDDGPTPGVTDKILDYLKAENIQAAFFVIGSKAQKETHLIKRMQDEGHIIANHTFTHPILTTVLAKDPNWKKTVDEEFMNTHHLLSPFIENQRDWYFRAPGGAWKKELADAINSRPEGQKTIGPLYWDIGGEIKVQQGKYISSADWDCWRQNLSVATCLSGYVNESVKFRGGVTLFHDINVKSAELIIQYIQKMQALNYRFVSLDTVRL